jgi:hypothetical protein
MRFPLCFAGSLNFRRMAVNVPRHASGMGIYQAASVSRRADALSHSSFGALLQQRYATGGESVVCCDHLQLVFLQQARDDGRRFA